MDITKYITKPQKVISICYGVGMLEEGIEQTGIRLEHIVIVEKEAFAIANLVRKMEISSMAACPIYTDIKTFDGSIFFKKVHGIIAGYPCTPFSNAGEMEGESSEKHLWPDIFKCFCAVRPLWGFFENVPNHFKMGYAKVKTDLESLGYSVEPGFYSAEETGAQIVRKRLFIFAMARPYRQVLRGKFRSLQKKKRGQKHFSKQSNEIRNSSSNVSIAPKGQIEYKHEYDRLITGSEIESILGSSADGHNYREDLIQLLGNAVHPPTAKLAFESLFKKQISSK